MKLYVMRHEERYCDPSFTTELTQDGKISAENSVKKQLFTHNITQVYSSPFIRTLQTVQPYCDEINLCPMVDYSLYEKTNDHVFIDETNRRKLSQVEKILYSVDSNYESCCDIPEYPESEIDIRSRVSKFLSMIMNKYRDTQENVLICTHESIVHQIYDCFKKDRLDIYPMGLITQIE